MRTLFGTDGIRGKAREYPLDVATMFAMGESLAHRLKTSGPPTVLLGMDTRESGPEIARALAAGLAAGGGRAIFIGVIPTPGVAYLCRTTDAVAAISISASHNPFEDNGVKIFGHDGMKVPDAIEEQIEDELRAIRRDSVHVDDESLADSPELVEAYERFLLAGVKPNALAGRKVVLDTGHGAAYRIGPDAFRRAGADVIVINDQPDGRNINEKSGALHPEKMARVVVERKADFGVAFDGDADRIGVIDDQGGIIWGDHVLILYARDVLQRTGKGQAVIFDVKCSQALPDAITAAGGKPIMWKTGHSLIKEKMREEHAPVAGEMSGHMFFEEGFYGHDDAIYGAARLLRILADANTSISSLLADVPKFVSTPEIRVEVDEERKFGIVADAVTHFRARHDVNDVDGVRVLYGDGWGLVRASNTQPVLVMRFEARSEERLREIRGEFEEWLREQGVAV